MWLADGGPGNGNRGQFRRFTALLLRVGHAMATIGPPMLKIHEFILPSGELSGVWLRRQAERLLLVSDDGELELPAAALRAVMLRYGAPFDADAMSQSQGSLELAAGASLRHVRHLAGYDVIA